MKLLLSPAKKMRRDDDIAWSELPIFLKDAERILKALRALSAEERKKLWKCSDALAQENERSLSCMSLTGNPSAAVFSYVGLAYQYLSSESLSESELSWLQDHLRILSGLYGVLRPMDGIVPYRLEMGAALSVEGHRDLYSFWNHRIADQLAAENDTVVSLASKEYEKAVLPYLEKEKVVQIVFADRTDKGMVTKGTFAKMARGMMTRWLAEKKAESTEEIKCFDLGYDYLPEQSDEHHLVFLKRR